MTSPQAQTVDIPKRLPLLNPLQNRQSSNPLFKDARLINCYGEYDAQDEAWAIFKRPGLSQNVIFAGSGTGQGIHFSPSGNTFYASGGNIYCNNLIWNANTTFALGTTTPLSIEDVSEPGALQYTGVIEPGFTGLTLYKYAHGTSNWTQTAVTIGNNLPLTPGIVYEDTAAYVMDVTGSIWGSNDGDPTTWNALNVILAGSTSDLGMGLAKQLSYIIAFKQNAAQVFYDAGNATGSPLSPVPDATIPYGCLNGFSISTIDNLVFWVTYNPDASPQVAMLSNLTPQIISNPAIERILSTIQFVLANAINPGSGYPVFGGLWSFCFRKAGHTFYVLTCAVLNITLAYDIGQNLWYIWTDVNGNYWPVFKVANQLQIINSTASAVSPALALAQQSATGNLYQIDDCYTYPTDYGTLPIMDIYTPNYDGGTVRRKYIRDMYFVGDKVPTKLKLRFSDDDYQNWSNFTEVDLNTAKPRSGDQGTAEQRRAYNFRYQAPYGFRMKYVDMQVDIGTL